MARRVREFDWSATTLGALDTWPPSRLTAVGMMLLSPVPIVMLWGADGVMIYNDAYAVFAGGRHPELLGSRVREGWIEVADFNDNVMRVGLAGGTLAYRDQELTLNRRGRPEQVWMDLDYSPIPDESGRPAGVMAIVVETTERVQAERRNVTQARRLTQMFEQAPGLMAMLGGPDHVFELANPAYFRLVGNRPLLGRTLHEALPEVVEQGFVTLMDEAYRTGKAFVGHAVPVRLRGLSEGSFEQHFIDFVYQPVTDNSGAVTGIFVEGADVTERAVAAARQHLLAQLLRDQRETGDPDAMMQAACAAMGGALGANRVGFFAVEGDGAIAFRACWTDGRLAPLTGTWPAAEIGPAYLAELGKGRVLGFPDAPQEALTAGSGFATMGVRGMLGAPVIRGGDWRAGLYVHCADARPWSGEELELAGAVAELTWDAVERADAVAALRHSEEQLRLATDAAEVGLWDLDLVKDVLYWPPRLKAMFGIAPEAPVSMQDFYTGLHPEDRASVTNAFAAALDPARRTIFDVEYRTIGKEDGRIRWVAAKGRGVFDQAGRCLRALGTALDITERKRVEARLHELNETLERKVAERTAERDRVWRNSRDLLTVIGADGILHAANPAWEEILGRRPEQVVGHSFHEFIWPEDAAITRAALADAAASRHLTSFENRTTHQDGTPRWISWHTSVEGDIVYAYGRHITAEKERRGRARGGAGRAAPGAEDGSRRPAHRRHRARLQQPAAGRRPAAST